MIAAGILWASREVHFGEEEDMIVAPVIIAAWLFVSVGTSWAVGSFIRGAREKADGLE
jgi:hypothetical protein